MSTEFIAALLESAMQGNRQIDIFAILDRSRNLSKDEVDKIVYDAIGVILGASE